jgi:hypothetical protein
MGTPAVAPPPGLKGLGGRLRGVLYGLATGGAVGAIAGSIDPNQAKTNYQDRQQVQAANVRFASARAAEQVANANRADAQWQSWDTDHQLAVQQRRDYFRSGNSGKHSLGNVQPCGHHEK